jgi:hypothetical protein
MLWPHGAAVAAIAWIEAHALGILAVEVYGSDRQARGIFQREWVVDPEWQYPEAWPQYVRRAAAQARREIRTDARLHRPDEDTTNRRYFIAVSTRVEYLRHGEDRLEREASRGAG